MEMFNSLGFIIGTTLMYSAPLIYTSLGGVLSESSGVINLGLEGMMTIGAFAGAAAAYFTGNPWLAFLIAGICGGLFALIHAVISITFCGNQTISGVAINFLAPALALFLCRKFFSGGAMTPPIDLSEKLPKLFSGVFPDGTFLNYVLTQDAGVYFSFILVFILWFVMYKTRFGLRVRAIGEHPRAADTLGISVAKYRYICVILSGFLAGLGGASVSIGVSSLWFNSTICGQGYIAMAAMIFGKWKPQGAMAASLVFGLATAAVVFFGGGDGLIPANFLSMLPYVATIIILILFVGKSNAPKANGVPYKKG